MHDAATTATGHRERLRAPVGWWVNAGLMVLSFWIATIVALPEPWAWGITGGLFLLAAAALLSYGSARVEVADGVLHAGTARIELHHLGRVEALDREQTRHLSGPGADARAFLLLRPYVARAVRVAIDDPADPAPYWLISSRRPERLAAALNAARPVTAP